MIYLNNILLLITILEYVDKMSNFDERKRMKNLRKKLKI